ncbi:MAG: hypothetical protein V1759_02155, partial [bacterium]
PFSFKKIYRSAIRAGASKQSAQKITNIVKKEVYPGIKTLEIFKRVKELLHKEFPKAALRFNLKEGIRKLGPTGFPFEKYVGEILRRFGYETKINQFLPGKCLNNYEIDFVAQKGKVIYIGECKYRNLFGERVHSKNALENYARFLDISNSLYFKSNKYKGFTIKSMIVTNTKFTSSAKNYSNCMGVELLGWNYPKNKGLEYLIEKERLYPITILPSLNKYLIDIFTKEKVMLVKDILRIDSQKLAKKLKIPLKHLKLLINEAEVLLNN